MLVEPKKDTMKEIKRSVNSKLPRLYELARDAYRDILIPKHRNMDEREMAREISRLYSKRLGFSPDLANPTRYTEKIQWSKLYDRNPIRSLLSDKLRVREWVASKIGDKYLIPLLGFWDSADEIDFSALPKSFVLKTNNASGTNIIVRDKAKVNASKICRKLDSWMKRDLGWYYFELQYVDIAPKIIAEQYMVDSFGEADLRDFKFLCFDGEPRFVWVDLNRSNNHERIVFDMDWNPQPWVMNDYPRYEGKINKPNCFEEMQEIARTLSEGFGHVRVDLYDINGAPYFGEMTFTSASGFGKFHPDKYDAIIGSLWNLQTRLD